MMFVASKMLWFLLAPFNLALFALTGAMIAMALHRPHLARKLGILSFVILLVFAVLPTGRVLVHALESRYPMPDPMPPRVSGIILLGGALETAQGTMYGTPQLKSSADRINQFVTLARRYPRARLVFTGGVGELGGGGTPEGAMIRDMLGTYGFYPGARLSVEDRSRTTAENVTLTKAMMQPRDDQVWLLVTSAWHMPRSVGAFRAQGWNVTPAPADYLTGGDQRLSFLDNLTLSHVAVKEIIGIAAYAITGKWTNDHVPPPAAR